MNIEHAKNKYIFNTKIDLGDNEFIKLREPSISELDGLNKASEENRVIELEKLLPLCLVDHSFTNSEGGKATNKEVYNFLKDSGTLFTEIIGVWIESLPFKHRLEKEKT
jgi:hypothetical protein